MTKINQLPWLRIALLNFAIVAVLGTIMRYKIGWSFPYLEQRHLQHAHSHFAFTGWVTLALFVLIAGVLQRDQPALDMKKYRLLIVSTLVCAYGMLVTFLYQGYGAFSITFATLSVLITYLFAIFYFRDMRRAPVKPYNLWFSAGLWFAVISSIGTFALAWMMANHQATQKFYLASLYFFLHFQYNGFFLFSCAGLMFSALDADGARPRQQVRIFWIFCISCVPAYLLSILWANFPAWLLVIVTIAAIAQFIGWIMLLAKVFPYWRERISVFRGPSGIVFALVAAAISVKYLLQLGSTIPEVSHMAFGFRHIIIAYLHLVLLAIVSVFVVSFIYSVAPRRSKLNFYGLVVFVIAVYYNQLVLGIQGIASITYSYFEWTEPALLLAAVLVFAGIIMIWWPVPKKLRA